jgi:endogenous inhibitor of DNA gyrase (YacG/DUF329 family)
MAKQVKCDECGRVEVADDLYGNPPDKWIEVARAGAPVRLHFCSPRCAAAAVERFDEQEGK